MDCVVAVYRTVLLVALLVVGRVVVILEGYSLVFEGTELDGWADGLLPIVLVRILLVEHMGVSFWPHVDP